MLLRQDKAFAILNWALVTGSAIIVLAYFILLYGEALGPNQLLGTSMFTTAVGLTHIFYMVALHPFLKRRSLLASSFVGTALFSLNTILLLLATGNFSSPYYALWIVMILIVGLFRPSVSGAFLALTTVFFISLILTNETTRTGLSGAVIPLITTYVAGGLSILLWTSHHSRRNEKQSLSSVSQELTKEQLKSEILLHHIGDGVMVVDDKLRIQLFNPAAEKLTGWSEAEAKGLDYHVVMPLAGERDKPLTGPDDPFVQSQKTSAILDGVTLSTKSGKKLTLSLMTSPIFENSQFNGGVAVFRDVTVAKAAERQRDEFISTASHEMRTPVAAIEGYTALALNPKVAKVDAKAQAYLSKAQQAAQHLGKLFQDLLSTTKLEEGKLPSHPVNFDIGQVVKAVVDELRFKAEKKQLRLVVKSSASTGEKALQPIYYTCADPERIQEVLTNLVDNAIKFTPSGEVSISLGGDSKRVTVGVHDTGLGIAPEDLPHLFQKFYRIDNSQTRTIGGTGLGLYICRQIIELYNGRMWVESTQGQGSHFYFSLPRVSYEKAQSGDILVKKTKVVEPNPAKPRELFATAASDKVE